MNEIIIIGFLKIILSLSVLIITLELILFVIHMLKIPKCLWYFHTTRLGMERHGIVYTSEKTIQANDYVVCDHCYKAIKKIKRNF